MVTLFRILSHGAPNLHRDSDNNNKANGSNLNNSGCLNGKANKRNNNEDKDRRNYNKIKISRGGRITSKIQCGSTVLYLIATLHNILPTLHR